MNRDTYARFLRSEIYKELLIGGKKKVNNEFDNQKKISFFFGNLKYSKKFIFYVVFLIFFGGKHMWKYTYRYIYTHTQPFRP